MATVVVAYNSEAELPSTLAALRAQLEPGDELVVVDNASCDGSIQAAKAAGARVIAMGRNAGFAAGCRAGGEGTHAPLLFFCNPDALPAPDALAALRTGPPEW